MFTAPSINVARSIEFMCSWECNYLSELLHIKISDFHVSTKLWSMIGQADIYKAHNTNKHWIPVLQYMQQIEIQMVS